MEGTIDSQAKPTTPRKRRSFLPRFGLRSLLIFGLLFCLLFGFVGRNYVRMREKDAAVETLRQAGATIYVARGDGWDFHPATPFFSDDPGWELVPSYGLRLIGWSGDASVRRVELMTDQLDAETLDEALAAFRAFPEMEGVGLGGAVVDDASLQALSNLPNLKSLALARTSVTSEGLARLPSPSRIRILWIYGQDGPADAVAGVGALEELRWLNVSHTSLAPEDLSAIASLPKLETLKLNYVATAAPDFYAPLANMQRLRNLSLVSSGFDDDAIASLSNLDRLESLAVDGISDDGLAKLDSLSRLRWLELSPPVTYDAALAFAAAHPECIVKYPTPDGDRRYYRGTGELDPEVAEDFYTAQLAVRDDDESDP